MERKYRAVRNVFIKPCDVSLYFVIFCKLGCTSYSVEGKSDELESIPGLKNIRAVPSVPSEVVNLNCFWMFR